MNKQTITSSMSVRKQNVVNIYELSRLIRTSVH